MKKLILGLCIGLLMGMSTNAFAAIGDKVQAVFAEFNYVVNGEAKVLESPVLVYEGVSYVRTTDISNMLGYDVTYKKDSRTIEFNSGEALSLTQSFIPESVTSETYGPTPEPTPNITPEPSVTPSPTNNPDGSTPSPAPTPTATPIGATPSPTASAEPTPTAVPTASPTPAPTASPEPTPVPHSGQTNDHAIYCQSLPKDSMAYIIADCY